MIYVHASFVVTYIALFFVYLFLAAGYKDVKTGVTKTDFVVQTAIYLLTGICALVHMISTVVYYAFNGEFL